MQVQSLCREDPLEEKMAIHSSILALEIPWTEEPGGLQSMGVTKSRTPLSMYECAVTSYTFCPAIMPQARNYKGFVYLHRRGGERRRDKHKLIYFFCFFVFFLFWCKLPWLAICLLSTCTWMFFPNQWLHPEQLGSKTLIKEGRIHFISSVNPNWLAPGAWYWERFWGLIQDQQETSAVIN